MNIDDLQTAMVAKIKTLLPKLHCETHGGRFDLAELAALSAATPAVFVAFLNVKGVQENGDGTSALACQFAAYVVTTDRKGLTRDTAARNLIETLVPWLPNNRFGKTGVGAPSGIGAQNLYSGQARGKAVALWAITWDQAVDGGASDFVDGIVPENLYINEELQEEP